MTFITLFLLSVYVLITILSVALKKIKNVTSLLNLTNKIDNYIALCKWAVIACIVVVLLIAVMRCIKRIKMNESVKRAFIYERSERKIIKGLLDTMTINQEKMNSSTVRVPYLSLTNKEHDLCLTIHKLPGMKEIDEYVSTINSSLLRSLSDYAVTSMYESKNGLYYEYILENVQENKSFTPENVSDLIPEKYKVVLQKGVEIDLVKYPHIILSGLTGSGKTTVLFSIIGQLLGQGSVLNIIDPKLEFQQFKKLVGENNVSNDVRTALMILECAKNELDRRKQLLNEQEYKEFGKTIKELDLSLYVVVVEELSALLALMDKKEMQQWNEDLRYIITLGRAFGVNLIICGQSLPVDVLPNKIRQNANTSILLGNAPSEIARMVFPSIEAINNNNVEKFQGYYNVSGYTKHPKIYYVPNLHKYNLNNFDTMEKLNNNGKKSKLIKKTATFRE